MPVERIRAHLTGNTQLYPDLQSLNTRQPAKPISIASTASTASSTGSAPIQHHRSKPRANVIISDDEDEAEDKDEDGSPPPSAARTGALNAVPPAAVNIRPAVFNPSNIPSTNGFQTTKPSTATPIHIPSNRDLLNQPLSQKPHTPIDDSGLFSPTDSLPSEHTFMAPEEAEKALRDLMSGGMNDIETEINEEEAYVKGFKEGIKLLPHQILGRRWMADREDVTKKRHGGILADDMGLGKTIQTLTRIVEGRAKKSDQADGWAAATLVVCPLALAHQWADEITKMTDGVTVLVHHGTSRTNDPMTLRKNRVVVTTYDVVKSEYEVHQASAKDETQAQLAAKKSKKGNKIDSDSDKDSDDSGSGFGKSLAVKKPAAKKPKAKGKCALFGVKWFRIVLDEAHNIKNRKTKGAIACCELEGKFRWALTGTPMQNDVAELYSLFNFLRIKPLNNWSEFDYTIARPVKNGRGAGRAMKKLQIVLKQVMLRRRKDQLLNGKAIIELPKRLVNIVSCKFDNSEKAFYDALENKMSETLKKLMKQSDTGRGLSGSGYISALLLLLRLRQACNHPILVAEDYKADMDAVDPKSKKNETEENGADDLADMFGQLGVTKTCQMCRVEIRADNASGAGISTHCRDCAPLALMAKNAERERPTSAKIRMILKLLDDIDDRSGREEKTIIFSQFTKMLDLIEPFLRERGTKYVRYDGSMDAKSREASLATIRNSTQVRVILISFKAGSTGLNLTACNNVILVDLWWNPALEDQAFDRAHRVGQTKDVNIYKLKIDETVEDRILSLQDKKRALAEAALSGDKIKGLKLNVNELMALFRPGARDDDDDDDD